MNLVNAFFIIIIGIAILEGIHKGFLYSAANLGSFFLSLLTSYLLYPVMSVAVKANKSIFEFLLYYTEGAEKIKSFEDTSILISDLSSSQLNEVVSTSSVSEPFATLIKQNVQTQAFLPDELFNIGEYYNMTIVCTVLNILSFLAVFILAKIVYTFILGAVSYTVKLPELKQYDRVTGALFGLSRGVLACFMIVTIIPAIFLVVPIDKVIEYFQDSSFGMFFFENNFLLNLIRGTV